MLTFKGILVMLLVCVLCCLLNLVIYNYMPWNIHFLFGDETSMNTSGNSDSVSVKHSSGDNYITILKQRKYKLVDVQKRLSDAEQGHNTSVDKNISAFLNILLYNTPVWFEDKEPVCNRNMKRCFQDNCLVTYNRSLLRESNAIIFEGPMPSFPFNVPLTSRERDPNQVWIFYNLETHFHFLNTHHRKSEWSSVFNWTMSYRLDSDIQHPYGALLTNHNPPERDYRAIFRAKKGFAMWIVSHCNAVSRRDDFVRLLQKYVPVDIIGGCGTNNCTRNNNVCRDNVGKEYKFYLSFENSLCKDYITEKFFDYFPLDLITILRGSSNVDSLLPNDTYINTADFSTVQDLANFMKRLAEDEDQYILYLKSKDRYVSKGLSWSYCNALCDICYKLNNLETYKMSYNDIVTWIENDTCVYASDIN